LNFRSKIQTESGWEVLLDDFQTDFGKVINDVPDYKFSKISYNQKANLIIDEVFGKETYSISGDNSVDYIATNQCSLYGDEFKIIIEYGEFQELLQPDIRDIIQKAILKIKHKFYISYVTAERHYYSVAQDAMLPNPKPNFGLVIPLDAHVGLLKNQGYIDLRTGLGLSINKSGYISLDFNYLTVYNSELNKQEGDIYIGLTSFDTSIGFGTDFAFKVTDNVSSFSDLVMRTGLVYQTKSGMKFGVHYYVGDQNENEKNAWGFRLGFGF